MLRGGEEKKHAKFYFSIGFILPASVLRQPFIKEMRLMLQKVFFCVFFVYLFALSGEINKDD